MLNDTYFINIDLRGWVVVGLALLFFLDKILTIHFAPEIKKFFREKLYKKKGPPVGFTNYDTIKK